MTRIKCLNFNSSDRREYQTTKGTTYEFYKDIYTNIEDPEDALFFLRSANGNAFIAETMTDKILKSLQHAAEALHLTPKIDESNPPKETGILEPDTNDLKAVDDQMMVVPEPYDYDKIKKLSKDQQTFIIKKIEGDKANIPKLEHDRINLILKHQEKGAEIATLLLSYE